MIKRSILLILVPVVLSAVEFYVSPAGDDGNPGSLEKPFRTLQRAQQAVRAAARTTPIHVYLRQGKYRLSQPLVFGPEDSGSDAAPVIWSAFPGERVTITGSLRLDLKWSPYRDGILRATVPAGLNFDQLFVDGQRQVRARFPNYDSTDPLRSGKGYQLVADGSNRRYDTWLDFNPEIFTKKRWARPETGIVHAFQSHNWGNLQYRIRAVDWEKHRILLGEGGWQMQRSFGIGKARGSSSPFFVENIFEELDSPGEWFLDNASGALYFMPPPGVDLKRAEVEVVVSKQLIRLLGTPARPVRNIIFRGIRFTGTGFTFLDAYEPLARGDWAIHRGGALYFEGAENCRVEDCQFEWLGGNAVFFSGYNRRHTVTRCRFSHIGESAVAFVGLPKAVRMYLTWDDEEILGKRWDELRKDMDLKPGPKTPDFPEDCSIEDAEISDIGEVGKQTAGVLISMSHRVKVAHCTIYNTPRAGICINDGTWGGHVIEHCDIWETIRETGEHGAFNSWGRDRYWLAETGGPQSMEKRLVLLDAMDTTHIRYNRIVNNRESISAGSWAIDLDDGSSNYAIHHNLMLGSTLKLRDGYYRKVWNNVSVGPVEIGFHVWPPDSEDEFYHNIIVVSGARPGRREPTTALIRPVRMPEKYPWGKRIDENLYWNTNTRRFLAGDFDWQQWQSAGHDRSSVFADPLFADPVHGDFRVREGSPALKIGFENFPMDQFGHRMTRIEPPGGEFEGTQLVTLRMDARGGEIRYTVDGADPTPTSKLYTGPIPLEHTATIRARTFRNGVPVGSEATATFIKVPKLARPSWLSGLLRAPDVPLGAQSESGRSGRTWLGAAVRNVRGDPELIEATGGQDSGVFLEAVPAESAPAAWGLRRSDVIVEVNGRTIEDIDGLVRASRRGVRTITVLRGYRRVTLDIPAAARGVR